VVRESVLASTVQVTSYLHEKILTVYQGEKKGKTESVENTECEVWQADSQVGALMSHEGGKKSK